MAMAQKAVAIYSQVGGEEAAYHLGQCESDAEKAAILEDLANRPEGELLEYLDQIADLLNTNPSSEVKIAVCRAMANAGDNSLPYLQEITMLLRDNEPDVKYQACVALAALGSQASSAELAVVALLDDPSEAVRCAACAALGAFEASSFANKMAALLNDNSPEVQGAACMALSQMGKVGAESAGDVASKLAEPRSRLQALHALGAMDMEGEKHVEKVVDCLEDQDAGIRLAAAQQCGQMAAAVKESSQAWSRISGLLGSSDGHVRCATALALGYMGREASDLMDSIKDMLEDDFSDSGVTALTVGGGTTRVPPSARKAKCAAAAALGLIVQAGAEDGADVYAAEVANLLDEEDWEVRMVGCEALAMMGECAKDQATRVSAIFDDERFAVRAKAARASGKLKDTDAASGLADLVSDNCPSVREEAMLALAELEDDGTEYIEKVFEKVSDFSPGVRAAAMTALGRMGQKGQCYAGAIAARLLEWEAPFVRVAGLEALGKMEDHGAAYADLVAEYFEDPQPSVRAAAATAMGGFSYEAEAYGEQLRALSSDPSSEVRYAATKALEVLRI